MVGANISSGHNLPPHRLFTKKWWGLVPTSPYFPAALSLNCRRGYHQIQLILVKSIIVKLCKLEYICTPSKLGRIEWKSILILKIPKIVKKCIEYWGTKKFCLTFSKHLCLKFKSLICFEVSKVRVLLFPFLQKKTRNIVWQITLHSIRAIWRKNT